MIYSVEEAKTSKKGMIKMNEEKTKMLRQPLSGPRKVVLCGKVPEPLSEMVRSLVKSGKYGTLNDFVEAAILEKVERETEEGGINLDTVAPLVSSVFRYVKQYKISSFHITGTGMKP